jgi:hypothetical protein
MSCVFKVIFAATILGLSFAAPLTAGPAEQDIVFALGRGDYAFVMLGNCNHSDPRLRTRIRSTRVGLPPI